MQTDDTPLISVVVTHYNYEDYVADAIHSVLSQTHQNFELVIVDDCSRQESWEKLKSIVSEINDGRIRVMQTETNGGQPLCFYAGFAVCKGDFICLLDPDDEYNPLFIEKMLRAMLNPLRICSLVFCNQRFKRSHGGLVTGTQSSLLWNSAENGAMREFETSLMKNGFSAYFPGERRDWLWTSASSMMFRRDAVQLAMPHKLLKYISHTDMYLAFATHFLAGTLFVHEALVDRGLHSTNDFNCYAVFSHEQKWGNIQLKGADLELDVFEALIINKASDYFTAGKYRSMLLQRIGIKRLARWAFASPIVRQHVLTVFRPF